MNENQMDQNINLKRLSDAYHSAHDALIQMQHYCRQIHADYNGYEIDDSDLSDILKCFFDVYEKYHGMGVEVMRKG